MKAFNLVLFWVLLLLLIWHLAAFPIYLDSFNPDLESCNFSFWLQICCTLQTKLPGMLDFYVDWQGQLKTCPVYCLHMWNSLLHSFSVMPVDRTQLFNNSIFIVKKVSQLLQQNAMNLFRVHLRHEVNMFFVTPCQYRDDKVNLLSNTIWWLLDITICS